MNEIKLEAAELTLDQIRVLRSERVRISLPDSVWVATREGHAWLEKAVAAAEPAYGINTGVGKLSQTRIETADVTTLQQNLVRSHAAGVGNPIPIPVVRLALALKALSLAQGYSGVRPEIVKGLLHLLSDDLIPVIPEKGSVGASGDLAPLAHLSLPLIGEGEVFVDGKRHPAAKALQMRGLDPLVLEAKEGLALVNGTQISTALAIDALFTAERNLASALVTGAMAVEAALGSYVPFDERIHHLRPHPGQREIARLYRVLLNDSEINRSHADCDRVQDPYSLRCQPQVLGACLEQLGHAARVLEREANSVSDNPLICRQTGEVLSGGNFHAEPVAMVADNMALAIAETGSLAERRVAMLIDSSISALPPFLTPRAGLDSGFMMAHVTAAALASENKSLAHPASVDSLPTSANQEDHVSMATFAARRLGAMNDNTGSILAIEYLAAAQGISLRRPLKSSALIEQAHAILRRSVPEWSRDRTMHPDIEAAGALIDSGKLAALVPVAPLDALRHAVQDIG